MTVRSVVTLDEDAAGPAAAISPAICWGDLVFVSGQAAIDPETLEVLGEDAASQARIVLDRTATILAVAGTELANVLRLECYLADAVDFGAWNEVFTSYFPDAPPARTTLVGGLALPGLRLEVQVIAGRPTTR